MTKFEARAAKQALSCGTGQVAGADLEIAEEGAHASNETEEDKTEQAVENPRNSEAADVKAGNIGS